MLKSLSRILVGVALAAVAYAQPRITAGAVTNAASYVSPDLPNGAVARGSFFVIKGQNMGPAQIQVNSSLPFPRELAGTSIKVTVGGTTVDAYMYYTSANQVAAILPSNTPSGTGTVTVTYNGQTSATAPIRVVDSSFGIFTLNQAGSGPGIVQNALSGTDIRLNTLTESARPGGVAIIWGTGLGPVTTPNEAGQAPTIADLPTAVEVYIGGQRANVLYKGRSSFVGLDQINVTVPQNAPEGCYVPVVVRAGDNVSNFATMSIARNGGACSDTTGLTGAQLESAQRNNNFRIGSIVLARTNSNLSVPGVGSAAMTADLGTGAFYAYNFNQVISSQGLGSTSGAATAPGSCTVLSYTGQEPRVVDVQQPTPLDAGASLTITGPNGTKQLERISPGIYSATLASSINIPGVPNIPGLPGSGGPPFLDPGSYTITGPGGSTVGAFSARLTLPTLLNWTNMAAVNQVTRSAGQTVTWSGGDPQGYVVILGASSFGATGGAVFTCIERASAGTFTIPAYVLSALPATVGDNIGFLTLNNVTQPVSFTATGLDLGNIIASSGSQKTVTYR
ncbi:MAG TPA: hypothetical protein VER03_17710 [Bryobacteraceae bacterium]|nr:hypothetical protein [Bryobacteraceae bacterium]